MRWWPLTLVVVLGCATGTRVVRLTPTTYEPRPAEASVQVFSSQLPQCPFEEIALVSAWRQWGVGSHDMLVRALRNKARELGGEALVRVGFRQGESMLSGTVIRFRRGDCEQ